MCSILAKKLWDLGVEVSRSAPMSKRPFEGCNKLVGVKKVYVV